MASVAQGQRGCARQLAPSKLSKFPELSGNSVERGFWGPHIAFSGEDEVDMLGSGEAWGFSRRKNQQIPGAHEIGAAISGPGIAGRKIN